jgi:hypothetical protein
MKSAVIFLSLFIITGCNDTKKDDDMYYITSKDTTSVDYIIAKSKANTNKAEICFRKTDSTTSKIIERKVQERQLLNRLVKNIKTIIKTDTVYVETSKNFWGKTKTKIKTVSDSVILETAKVDTIN